MIQKGWQEIINSQKEEEYFKKLKLFLIEEYSKKEIYPEKKNIFKAFEYVDISDVKVVLLGQDPYHQKGQAQGLSFSVPSNVKIPPSLRNIYKEIENDLGVKMPSSGDLTFLAKQGVLLLNTIMSVEDSKPLSHKEKGWEIFTNYIIEKLNKDNNPKVFILWGNSSKEKKKIITNKNHLVLQAPHPSPLSAYNGFFGCKHFSKANIFLKENNLKEINWQSYE